MSTTVTVGSMRHGEDESAREPRFSPAAPLHEDDESEEPEDDARQPVHRVEREAQPAVSRRSHTRSSSASAMANGAQTRNARDEQNDGADEILQDAAGCADEADLLGEKIDNAQSPASRVGAMRKRARQRIGECRRAHRRAAITAEKDVVRLYASLFLPKVPSSVTTPVMTSSSKPEPDDRAPMQRIAVCDVRLGAAEFARERLAGFHERRRRKPAREQVVILPADDEENGDRFAEGAAKARAASPRRCRVAPAAG